MFLFSLGPHLLFQPERLIVAQVILQYPDPLRESLGASGRGLALLPGDQAQLRLLQGYSEYIVPSVRRSHTFLRAACLQGGWKLENQVPPSSGVTLF